ncbi:hypothetical protein ILUMI_26055 [Ignelater luminosus]|uniref:Poly [ADP-ribose] polymerase n=1 Tax=Ignelater luminosus TaxID=2038154 RepID=A0A8K0CAG9_IGNLU|nr:hypothetical protein ILUMI_26055 [Ignelater luminosus]
MGNLCCTNNSEQGEEAARIVQEAEPRIQQEQERHRQLEELRQVETRRQQQLEKCRQAALRRQQLLKEHRQAEARWQEQKRQRAEARRRQLEEGKSFPTVSEILGNQKVVPHWVGVNSQVVAYVNLSKTSAEYRNIEREFRRTNKKFFQVSGIERVENPYLLGAYLLKKEELLSRHGFTEEILLFHGTERKNIDDICTENLNWRICGKGAGHTFGKGVYFTPISYYATHYCDKDSNVKVMLVMKVLVSNACLGYPCMEIPPDGFDTSKKDNGHKDAFMRDNNIKCWKPVKKPKLTKNMRSAKLA